jgi:ribosomal 30S subunit maturation factor RimM
MTEYFKIGKLVAAHGLKGELLLKHHSRGCRPSLLKKEKILLSLGLLNQQRSKTKKKPFSHLKT